VAKSFPSAPGVEYLSLPAYAKQPDGGYLPASMNLPMSEFVQLRTSLLLAAVESFRPQLLVVDKEPLGVRGELQPSLRFLKNEGAGLVCGFRDILDSGARIRSEWARKGVLEGLELFDRILVYGEERLFDFRKEYGLPDPLARKLTYTGYIQPVPSSSPKGPFVSDLTMTVGGGADGAEFVHAFLDLIERGRLDDLRLVLLAGPFSPSAVLERASRICHRDFRLIGFTSDTAELFRQSRLVISMGGYNSLCELHFSGKVPLVLPRIAPREEQLIRARIFSERGLCEYLHPGELGGLEAKIRAQLDRLGAGSQPGDRLAPGLEAVTAAIEGELA
jgi:predicted glycosyltransferase